MVGRGCTARPPSSAPLRTLTQGDEGRKKVNSRTCVRCPQTSPALCRVESWSRSIGVRVGVFVCLFTGAKHSPAGTNNGTHAWGVFFHFDHHLQSSRNMPRDDAKHFSIFRARSLEVVCCRVRSRTQLSAVQLLVSNQITKAYSAKHKRHNNLKRDKNCGNSRLSTAKTPQPHHPLHGGGGANEQTR